MSPSPPPAIAGWAIAAAGVAISAMVRLRPDALQAPEWVAHVAAAAFVLAGAVVVLRAGGRDRAADGVVCLLLAVFVGLGAWASLGPDAGECVAGGPGGRVAASPTACRVAFGSGALVVLAMLVLAIRRLRRGSGGG